MFTNRHPAQRSRKAEVGLMLTAAVAILGVLLPIAALAQTETVIHNFVYPTRIAEGCPFDSLNIDPHVGLLFYQGHLYGTTPEGGTGAPRVPDTADGMVFRLSKPKTGTLWDEKTLHSFQPEPQTTPPTDDGTFPCSRLIEKNGALYGTTIYGGNSGLGTVFALVPPGTGETTWTEYQLYNFLGESDGAYPYDGLVMDSNGALYGVSRGGFNGINGPSVFQLVCSSGVCNVNTLVANNQGILYNGDLLLDASTGALFGTTQNGGTNGYGNVFQLTPSGESWTYDDLYDFTGGGDGAYPNGALVGGAGDLLGTTQGGGTAVAGSGSGVLFELRQLIAGNPYKLFIQHTFKDGSAVDGAIPNAGLYQSTNGTLWGTTTVGGYQSQGTIFRLAPDRVIVHDWHYKEVYSFAGGLNDGANPQCLLTEDTAGNLYGTTNSGGSSGEGIVFQWTP